MMTTIRKRTGIIFSLLLLTAIQMFNTACSRKLFRDSSSRTPKVMSHQDLSDNESTWIGENISASETATNTNTREARAKNTDTIVIAENDMMCDLPSSETCGDEIIGLAMKYIGLPYCYGGLGKKCIDCSGFVLRVFQELGISLPHNAQAQSKYGTVVKCRDELIKGDIVFFKGSYKTSKFITHAGIYNGNNMFVHASSGSGVTITSMDDSWWKKKFVSGARVLQ